VSDFDADWAAIHPLGDLERFSKIRDLVDALMEPGFELAKLAMNPSCDEVDTVDELIDTVNAWYASRRPS
jgi:hypothetical protein